MATSMRLITVMLTRTPAAVGRVPTNLVDLALTTPMRREAGDKKKVAALLPLGINPAVGDRGKQVRAVGTAVGAAVDGVAAILEVAAVSVAEVFTVAGDKS